MENTYFLITTIYLFSISTLPNQAAYIPYKACEVHYKPGDVIIGGIYPLYYTDETPCDGPLWIQLITMVEAMTYAIELINQRDDILRNVTIGYYVRNGCGEEDVTTWTVLSMISPSREEDFAKACPEVYDHEPVGDIIGIVGTARSSTTLLTSKIASVYNIPLMSYWATSDELSNIQRFPYFLRTLPPDKFQVGAIMKILQHYNWKYIALFYSIDSYGVHGARQIQTLAEDLDICIAVNLPVSNYPSANERRDIADKLIENDKISVIVIFSLWNAAYGVLKTIHEHGMARQYTFIGSDGWGGDLIKELSVEPWATLQHGSIFVRQYSAPNPEFQDYLKWLADNQDRASQWYRDALLEIKQANNCTDWEACPIPMITNEMTVINAVFAFAYALDASIRTECLSHLDICDEALDGSAILKHLFDVSFDGPGGRFEFDENGDTTGQYLYQNWRPVNGVYQMVDVGMWDPTNSIHRLNIDEDKTRWKSPTGNVPVSLCVDECGPGTIAVPLKKKCCWGCDPCPSHAIVVNASYCLECSVLEWPDDKYTQCIPIDPNYIALTNPIIMTIIFISALGVCLCGLAVIGVIVHRQHPLVKASSRELSCVNLTGLTLACVSSLLTILRPSSTTCGLSEASISLSFTFIFAPILLKVNRIWRIFQQGSKSVKRPRFVGPKQQLILTAATISIQVIISGLSTLLASSTPTILIPSNRSPSLSIYCQFGSGFMTSCIYNMILIVFCCHFALRSRKVPSNYNESKFIAISVYSTLVVCVAAIPVYSTAVDVTQMVATLCVTLLLNSYLTLSCIYLPKLYAIHFAGEDLSIETWRTGQVQPTVN